MDRVGEAIEAARTEGYSKGFTEGVAVATKGIEAERSALLAAISECVSDQRFDFERANATVQSSLTSLIKAVVEVVASGTATVHFEDLVAAKVRDILAEAQAGTLVVQVSPDRIEDIRAVLADQSSSLDVEPAAHLTENMADIRWANGVDRVDLDRVVGDVTQAIDDYCEQKMGAADERRNRAG